MSILWVSSIETGAVKLVKLSGTTAAPNIRIPQSAESIVESFRWCVRAHGYLARSGLLHLSGLELFARVEVKLMHGNPVETIKWELGLKAAGRIRSLAPRAGGGSPCEIQLCRPSKNLRSTYFEDRGTSRHIRVIQQVELVVDRHRCRAVNYTYQTLGGKRRCRSESPGNGRREPDSRGPQDEVM